jgi:hypothetical protein
MVPRAALFEFGARCELFRLLHHRQDRKVRPGADQVWGLDTKQGRNGYCPLILTGAAQRPFEPPCREALSTNRW